MRLFLALVGILFCLNGVEASETKVQTRMVCISETAIMALVEAEMNGGVEEINKVLKPLLMTRQCAISSRRPFIVKLQSLLLKYRVKEGGSEVWETDRGFFVVVMEDDAV